MLFYPILYSFLPYFVTFTPTPQVEKTVKMPILPVLMIFVCVFSLLSSPSLLLITYFIISLSLLLSFFPSHFFLVCSSSTLRTKIKRSNKNASPYFIIYYPFALTRQKCLLPKQSEYQE